MGSLDKILYEGSVWTVHRAVLSFTLHKSIFLHLVHYGKTFYVKYINSDDRNICIDDYGNGVKPKQKVRNIYY